MNAVIIFVLTLVLSAAGMGGDEARDLKKPDAMATDSTRSRREILGPPGLMATYRPEAGGGRRGGVVGTLVLSLGPCEQRAGRPFQWLSLHATKANGQSFQVWILTEAYPPATLRAARQTTARYIVQEGDTQALEFRHQLSGAAVLPSLGAWSHLFPRAVEGDASEGPGAERMRYLGHTYRLEGIEHLNRVMEPARAEILRLRPDVLIGVPHNTRQRDEARRYDNSDYELMRLTKRDYDEMIEAGMNCLRVDKEQAGWIGRREVFYWGIGPEELSYPEYLYRSNYLGPVLFLDEPAVGTRDQMIRPRLTKDQEFRQSITPQVVLDEFHRYFHEAKYQGAPAALLRGLAARSDVDVGDMSFLQENLYTWETMVSTARCQLGESAEGPPAAMVFEPPGRFGARRTLPEMDMAYGCQIPVDDPKNLAGIIYGFLRGAARLTEREWGTSIYGQVDRADASWLLTHAYDLGAQYFFFWDSSRLACVPYGECLALTRTLRAHARTHPDRDLRALKQAAEVAILLPAGYNLGHVHMGRGNLWGLGELNLERVNRQGVKYRTVMGNFFAEIERCIRMGVAYDLFWDIEGHPLVGYREIVHVREDGKVEVRANGKNVRYENPRTLERPEGDPPQLTVELSAEAGPAPLGVSARAVLVEGTAPVYYTLGADTEGVYRNVKVLWELYGPGEEDYRFLLGEDREPRIRDESGRTRVEIEFKIGRPGQYRLRAATVDWAGRTTVVWKNITVAD